MTNTAILGEENRKKAVRDLTAKCKKGSGSDTLTKGR
jgi:hypothetical protein